MTSMRNADATRAVRTAPARRVDTAGRLPRESVPAPRPWRRPD
ncbi:MAG: hypothetical protein PHY45_15960 [Rhodocyclaceae bacterium]|nr:hypothetical protein [Rhodocyclaceae bacterium]